MTKLDDYPILLYSNLSDKDCRPENPKNLTEAKGIWSLRQDFEICEDRINYLAKSVDLDNPEMVNAFIMGKSSESCRETLVKAYNYYAKTHGIAYFKPKMRCTCTEFCS